MWKVLQRDQYMALDRNFISSRNFIIFLLFFKITYFGYQVSQKGRLLQLFLTMSLLSTTQIWIMLLLPTILCSRFERLANKLKTQVEHQVITKHKKEINRATIHHFNKKNFHHAYYTYGKARKTFLVFSKFCKFLFDFSYANFYGFSRFCQFLWIFQVLQIFILFHASL